MSYFQVSRYLLFGIILLSATFSCKNDSDNPEVPMNDKCQIEKITHSSGDFELYGYENGYLISEKTYSGNGELMFSKVYNRDQAGKLLSKVSYYSGFSMGYDSTVYHYENNRLIKVNTQMMSCGWYFQTHLFKYNDRGQLKSVSEFATPNWDGKLPDFPERISEYTLDGFGRIINKDVEYINSFTGKSISKETHSWTYDPQKPNIQVTQPDQPNSEFLYGICWQNLPNAKTYKIQTSNNISEHALNYEFNTKGYPNHITVKNAKDGSVSEDVKVTYICP